MPAPANNTCATAVVIASTPYTSPTIDTTAATQDGSDPTNTAAGLVPFNSVWYEWTAPSNGTFAADTLTSNYDTTLGVYTGACGGTYTEIASNDDQNGATTKSLVMFTAVATTTYRIVVGSFASGGGSSMTLRLTEVPTPVVYGPDTEVGITVTEWPSWGNWDEFTLYLRLTQGAAYVPNQFNDTYDAYGLQGFDWSANGGGPNSVRFAIVWFHTSGGGTAQSTISSTTTITVADGDAFGLRAVGSTLTAYRRSSGVWSQILTCTDSSIAAGGSFGWHMPGAFNPGSFQSQPGYYNNFFGGTISASPGAFPVTGTLDDFTRADAATLGSQWAGFYFSNDPGPPTGGISTNRAYNSNFDYPAGASWGYMFGDTVTTTPIVGSTVFGTKGTVQSTRTFLANLDDTTRVINLPGTFYIGGDLIVTGTITGVVGAGSLGFDDLTDVTITSPAANDALSYNGSAWVNTQTPRFGRVGIGAAADSSAKLIAAGQIGSTAVAAGSSSTAKTLDWNDGNTQLLTLTGNCTLTLSNPKDGFSYGIVLKQDATGSRTVTWPSAVKWAGGSAPTLTTTAAHADLVRLTWFAGLGASGNYVADYVLNFTPA